MPYKNTWEQNGLLRKFTGVISGEEILESNFALHEDPRFSDIKYIINDFSEIAGHSIEEAHTKIYAYTDEIISNSKRRLKIALVVSQSEYIPIAESYRELMDGKLFECEIVNVIDDARLWIGQN